MKVKIGGLVENVDLTMYRLTTVQDEPGAAGEILQAFAENKINLEYITESSTVKGYAVMAICVDLQMAEKIDQVILQNINIAKQLSIKKEEHVSVIGIYSPHFREKPRLAAQFCQTLGKAGINILGLSRSISSISAVILDEESESARDALLQVFELP